MAKDRTQAIDVRAGRSFTRRSELSIHRPDPAGYAKFYNSYEYCTLGVQQPVMAEVSISSDGWKKANGLITTL